ncbi:MAG TPA: class I SAM-dependent methyltransferase [Syntrophomonadaceae bacterium]|nr:class I SAM-dependent methyltransferase [Syntrophomonadaceae bacterium]
MRLHGRGGRAAMRELHETLLYIAYNLANQNQIITMGAIRQPLEWMLQEEFNLEKEMTWLTEKGFLRMNSEKEFSLSEIGKTEAVRINRIRAREDFNQLINCATASTAYLDFCEETYGYRMHFFNMMDKEQLDYLFNSVFVSKSDTILDLGCGTGCILDNLVKKYACQGIGIDQLDEPTVRRCSPRISYIEGDLDALADYHMKTTLTLAVDSLYFSNDLDRLIRQLKGMENNRLYLYYSQYIFDETKKDETLLHCDHSRLASILRKNDISYRVVNYSNNEHVLYEKALKALPKYQEALVSEGNGDLYEKKIREYRSGKEMYDKGLASRYLYIAECRPVYTTLVSVQPFQRTP